MIERRRKTRRKSLLGGRIAFGRRNRTMDCLVRNVSAHGRDDRLSAHRGHSARVLAAPSGAQESYVATVIWRKAGSRRPRFGAARRPGRRHPGEPGRPGAGGREPARCGTAIDGPI